MGESKRFCPPADLLLCYDIGKTGDPTACVVMERSDAPGQDEMPELAVVRVEELPLRTPYPEIEEHIVSRTRALIGHQRRLVKYPIEPGRVDLVLDATGVGRVVLDYYRRAVEDLALEVHIAPIIFTGGRESRCDGEGVWCAPKLEIVSALQVVIEQKRFKIAGSIPLADRLVDEAIKLKVKQTPSGQDTWRGDGAHDDIILAVACGAWWATQTGRWRPETDNRVDRTWYDEWIEQRRREQERQEAWEE